MEVLDKANAVAKEEEKIARGFYQAEIQGSIKGVLNIDAVRESEVVVITLPSEVIIQVMKELSSFLHPRQFIISTVVSMKKMKGLFCYTPLADKGMPDQGKSGAEVVQDMAGHVPVVSAFQTVPATYLNNLDSVMNIDVLVASDYSRTVTLASKLIRNIPNLRPLNVGPLENSRLIESLTPLLLNAAILNNLQDPSIRVVPWMPSSFEK